MDKLSKFAIPLMTILSYVFSLFSALYVFPYIWLPLGIMFTLLGLFWISQYTHRNRGVVSIALFTNGTFISLGQYLETVVPAISILVNILGVILSFVMMLIWYYWKEGQRHVQIRIKQEKAVEEVQKDTNIFQKIKVFIRLLKRQRSLVKEKGYSSKLAFQFAYIEYQEEKDKQEEKNSLDFILGREVILQRNEYDQSQGK